MVRTDALIVAVTMGLLEWRGDRDLLTSLILSPLTQLFKPRHFPKEQCTRAFSVRIPYHDRICRLLGHQT